jgi:hypothetical protein
MNIGTVCVSGNLAVSTGCDGSVGVHVHAPSLSVLQHNTRTAGKHPV